MTFGLMLALPSWNYLVRDDKEQEPIFRGRQISNAVARFQRKNGNALPATFEQLVEGKYLRKAYKDPMTKDGKWRVLRPRRLPVTPPAARGNPRLPPHRRLRQRRRSVLGQPGPTTGPSPG